MNNFIFEDYISNTSICDRLIENFKSSNKKSAGKCYDEFGNPHVDLSTKDSLDLYLPYTDPIFEEYAPELISMAKKYMEQYPMVKTVGKWGIRQNLSMQYYKPNGGFKKWHTERVYSAGDNSNLLLAFITYLNDVEEGGTEFYHQNITTKAKKGSTIIFPVDWTFMHRGQISSNEEKYIIAGWFSVFN
jgi:hypothetical protein